MSQVFLISNASQVVTLIGPKRPRVGVEMSEVEIIENGSILIEDGVIGAVGTSVTLGRDLLEQVIEIDARGSVVMPGFVDAHTHPVFAGIRTDEYEMRAAGLTYQEIAARGGGIQSTVEKTRAATDEELLAEARTHAGWFLKHGTTTIEAKTGYGLSLEDEIRLLRIIHLLDQEGPLELVPTLLAAHVVPLEYGHHRDDYLKMMLEDLLPIVGRQKLAEYNDVFCEQGAFSLSESRALMLRAQEVGLKLRIHANQFSPSGAAELAAELGVDTADHLDHINDQAISALGKAGVIPILLPGVVLHLGLDRYAPARAMIDAGLPVVLATDFNPGSSPTPNMQIILSLACTQMNLTPAEAVTAATINAAYSLNRGHRSGSIEIGKQADLVIYECDDYREIPYLFAVNHVSQVMKKGVIVFTK